MGAQVEATAFGFRYTADHLLVCHARLVMCVLWQCKASLQALSFIHFIDAMKKRLHAVFSLASFTGPPDCR